MLHKEINKNFYPNIKNQSDAGPVVTQFPFPTIEECAILAADAYNTDKDIIPSDWKRLNIYPDANSLGYFGKAYTKDWETPNAMLVIAHRGTILNFGNIQSDLKIALEKAPDLGAESWKFAYKVSDSLGLYYDDTEPNDGNPDHPKYRGLHINKCSYTSVGHSLGAVLAEMTICRLLWPMWYYEECRKNIRSISFENPGAKNPTIDYLNNIYSCGDYPVILSAQLCYAYQAGVNIINSCNEQIGSVYRITSTIYNYVLDMSGGLPLPPPAEYLLNSTYVIDNTIDQHPIDKIVKLLVDKKFEAILLNEPPFGFQKGYVDYLDSHKNHTYWKDYFTTLWEADTQLAFNLRQSYHNDQEKFEKEAFEALNLRYKEAQGKIKPNNSITKISIFKNSFEKTTEQIISEFHHVQSIKEDEHTSSACLVM